MKTVGRSRGIRVLLLAAMAFPAAAAAQEKQESDLSPREKARMEAMTRAAAPGEAHKRLDTLAGRFSATVKTWSGPSSQPHESSGISVNKWVLGDRFVQQQFEGTSSGEVFAGFGYIGYDNFRKKYTWVWMDTTSTAMMTSTGDLDPEGKFLTFSGSMNDPLTGKATKMTEKLTVADKNGHTLEIWTPDPAGKPFKMMEVTYVRD